MPGITRGGEFPQAGTECSCTYIDAKDVTPAKLDEVRRLRKPTVIIGALAHWTDERCSWDAEHLSSADGDAERMTIDALGTSPVGQVLTGYPMVGACNVMKMHMKKTGQKFSDPDFKRAYKTCMAGERQYKRTRQHVFFTGMDEKYEPYMDTDLVELDFFGFNVTLADVAHRYLWGYKDPGYDNPQSLSWYGLQVPKWSWSWLDLAAKARKHCAKQELPWYLEPGTDSRGKSYDWARKDLAVRNTRRRMAEKMNAARSQQDSVTVATKDTKPAQKGEGQVSEGETNEDLDGLLVDLGKKTDRVEEVSRGNMHWHANGPGARSLVYLPLVAEGGAFNWWSPLKGHALFATWPRYMHLTKSVFHSSTNPAEFGIPAILDYWGHVHPILLEGEGPRFGSDAWDWSQARHNTTHIRGFVPASECLARTGDVYLNYGNWMSWMSPEPSFLAMGEETMPEKEDLAHFFVKGLYHAVFFKSEQAMLEVLEVYERLSAYSGDPDLLGATLAEIAAMRDLIVGDAPKTRIAAREKRTWQKIEKALASVEEFITAHEKGTAADEISERWQEVGRKVDFGPLRNAVDVSTPLEAFVRNAEEWVSNALARSKAWVSQLIGGGDESELASARDEPPTTSSEAEL